MCEKVTLCGMCMLTQVFTEARRSRKIPWSWPMWALGFDPLQEQYHP